MYFTINKTVKIESIEQLMELTIKKTYGLPSQPDKMQSDNLTNHIINYNPTFHTTGIFRGQSNDWDLIPSVYRNKDFDLEKENSEIVKKYRYRSDNSEFYTFAKFAGQQNHGFPKTEIEQMIIAQHYGIKTPLLDWTKNIFVAVYFALDLKDHDDDKNLEPFIYHIYDERMLATVSDGLLKTDDIKNSSLVSPLPIDRRVERQFSVFTFHPHPLENRKKIPINKYIISDNLFIQLWQMMEGMGFSSSHHFPDYAGLAERIKKGYML